MFTAGTYDSTPYLTGCATWNDRTTIVRQPGLITSHDFPFQYSNGDVWRWDVYFNISVTINIILYNASFNILQVWSSQTIQSPKSKLRVRRNKKVITCLKNLPIKTKMEFMSRILIPLVILLYEQYMHHHTKLCRSNLARELMQFFPSNKPNRIKRLFPRCSLR